MRRYIIGLLLLTFAIGGVAAWHIHNSRPASKLASASNQSKTQDPRTAGQSHFNKQQYSLSAPNSIWVIVNKQRPLKPINYAPADLVVPNVPLRVPGDDSMQLRSATAAALETMFASAKGQGIDLMLSSGYRSYSFQVSLYNSYIQTQGTAAADTFSARPGYSEHQTGLAADVEPTSEKCDVDQCFGALPEGKWLAANAYKYGFVIRYSASNHSFTGYEPEPWHVRFIGIAASAEVHKEGAASLEQFFDLPAAPGYQ